MHGKRQESEKVWHHLCSFPTQYWVDLLIKKLFGSVSGKKINILGFAFKSNTNDTRESSAIKICKNLLEEGAILYIHDPKVNKEQISKDLPIKNIIDPKESTNWFFSNKIEETAAGADAIVVLTEWEEYKNIDWNSVIKKMAKPAWVFDSRSIVNVESVKKAGLNLWRLGDGSQKD